MDINNYYFKNIDSHLVYQDYWDFNLSSDDQGICLDYALTCGGVSNQSIIQDKLVLWYDVNDSGTTIDGSSLTSLVEWTGATIQPSSGITLCDFGLTGVDNGRYDMLSGITVNLTSGDTKFIMYPVTGYTIQQVTYTGCTSAITTVISAITSTTCVGEVTSTTVYETTKGIYDYPWLLTTGQTNGCDPGTRICTDGGFYQGYFKLDFLDPDPTYVTTVDECGVTATTATPGDPDAQKYQILPTEFEDGWTMETWVKWTGGDCCYSATTTATTATTLTCLSGNTLNDNFPNNEGFFFYIGTRAENKFKNVFSGESGYETCGGVPLTPTEVPPEIDMGTANWFLKTDPFSLRGYTSCCIPCEDSESVSPTTGSTPYCDVLSENALGFRVTPDGKIGYRKLTVTGDCFNNKFKITGTTMEEKYSDSVLTTSGSGWSHIAVTYTQGSNVKNTLPAGVLRIWLNGRVILKVDDFIGLQLRALDEKSNKQLGVPFNMSWGGGTQGLLESQTFGGPDYDDRGGLIDTYFSGTFKGELSQLRFYEKPLNILEIRNNFFVEGCPSQGRYCKRETFGGAITVQPSSEFCSDCTT
jgi:hypothetical protein